MTHPLAADDPRVLTRQADSIDIGSSDSGMTGNRLKWCVSYGAGCTTNLDDLSDSDPKLLNTDSGSK
eukprot:CAMPEP_0175086350 /NCGR_PEP_ID=MMETSP0052_2-20121109/29198_1 /TAXON_ID=51329 ORGANISM="Polytomella parva, Strain SAG 63-3" /NCGR_SAMPLE_ID=MMETSP0052_2 /ASSEMBLY_ACC=CAM_ASM_000194 /LENGTH=66 /DNA_ID=CAMNT_0016358519 /DNA_START=499 /DNA_END=696 /DNA_ORIENTATION=-